MKAPGGKSSPRKRESARVEAAHSQIRFCEMAANHCLLLCFSCFRFLLLVICIVLFMVLLLGRKPLSLKLFRSPPEKKIGRLRQAPGMGSRSPWRAWLKPRTGHPLNFYHYHFFSADSDHSDECMIQSCPPRGIIWSGRFLQCRSCSSL